MATDETFGSFVRRLRTEREIGLREFAAKVGLSPTYLSQIERDEFAPPSEEKIRAMALLLRRDPDELLAIARRIPEDLQTILKERQRDMGVLLRTANRMNEAELQKLINELKKQHGGQS